jgi:hypothetical protein
MNRNREHVAVQPLLVDAGLKYGRDIVAHYANGGSPRSRSRSGDRGAESNPILQAQAKIGEAAFALLCGLDPRKAVKWTVDHADCGWDVVLDDGRRVDVKTSIPRYNLIWNRDVNDLFYEKQFDVLVSVSIDPNDFSQCWIEGWITKVEFYAKREIADGTNSGLELDTWFMNKGDLWPIKDLIGPAIDIDAEIEAALAPRRMSRAHRMALAWVESGSSMQPQPVAAAPPKPTVSEWRLAFRYDYLGDAAMQSIDVAM